MSESLIGMSVSFFVLASVVTCGLIDGIRAGRGDSDDVIGLLPVTVFACIASCVCMSSISVTITIVMVWASLGVHTAPWVAVVAVKLQQYRRRC